MRDGRSEVRRPPEGEPEDEGAVMTTRARPRITRGLKGPWVLLAVAIMAGCAGLQAQRPADPRARLVERAKGYWDARVKGDLVETYRFHEPNFKKRVTLTAFLRGRGATTVLDYEVKDVRIEGAKGFVTMRVNYTVIHPLLVKRVEPRWGEIEEQWRWVDGEWYRRYRLPVGDPYPEPAPWDTPSVEGAGEPGPVRQ